MKELRLCKKGIFCVSDFHDVPDRPVCSR